MSARPVTIAADPVVSGLRRLERWHRGRALTLAGLGLLGASLAMQVELPLPIDEPERVAAPAPPTPLPAKTEPLYVPICEGIFSQWRLEPRLERRDGAWLGRDVLGTSTIEIADADPIHADAAAREWVSSICDSYPRLLYLVGFEHAAERDSLVAALEDACPSMIVRFTELAPKRCWGKYYDPIPRPPSVSRR